MKLYTKKLRTILQSRIIFKVLAVIFIIYSLLITNLKENKSKYNDNTNQIVGIITRYKEKDNVVTIYVKGKETVIGKYYKKENEQLNYKLGDKIKITGALLKPETNTVPNTFNYKRYLYINNIHYIIKIKKINKIQNNTSILYYIKNKIINRLNKIDKKGYLYIYILGDKKEVEEGIINNYQNNGTLHLFSISGMHISILAGIILYLLRKISYNIKINYLIVIILLLFYTIITDFPPSLIRATITYILLAINKSYNLKIKEVDIILLVLIIVLIINPMYLYNIGILYSYSISLSLVICKNKININKNKIIKSIYISLICFIVVLPITINNFYQINIIGIMLNIFLIPFITILYIVTLLSFIFPIIIPILDIMITILEKINELASSIEITKIILPKMNIYIIIFYYILIILFVYKTKYIVLLIMTIIIHTNYNYINKNNIITILDVGQGDSIHLKINNENILIDTGGIYNKDITNNKTIPYLKSIGAKSINKLIITHGDFDHMGEAINIINNFKVEKVIFNCGPYNDLEKELIKVLDKKKIKYYSCIKELNIDSNRLYFLQTKLYDNENDNSNVIYTGLNGYKFMFMGDASTTTEKEILDKYNLSNIDVLKVGHHGSKTSSSKEFIDEINPKYSVISVGKNNRYGHPNKEVLGNLNESKIYRTDIDGSIMFKIKNNKLKIETCSP